MQAPSLLTDHDRRMSIRLSIHFCSELMRNVNQRARDWLLTMHQFCDTSNKDPNKQKPKKCIYVKKTRFFTVLSDQKMPFCVN